MSKTVKILDEFKINYLTQAQYDAEVAGGTVQPDELYLTLDNSASATQTLTNKTIDYTDNTIKNTPAVVSSSQTISPTKETQVVIDTASTVLTLGTAPYAGYELPVLLLADASITYTGIGGTYTDQVLANRKLTYTYTGSAWFCTSCPVSIGDVYTQHPDTDTPAHLYGGQWVEQRYGGAFFRAVGTNADDFTPSFTGHFTSATTFVADATLPATAIVGKAFICSGYMRTITAISGKTITLSSALGDEYAIYTKAMIGQSEKLPNIKGTFSLGAQGLTSSIVGACDGNGAFSKGDNGSGQTVQGKASPATVYRSWNFDASKTTGTGSGVYGDSNHVQPVNITIKMWRRTA